MIFDVAVVGGGFSGTMVAAQLARRGIASALVDGSGRIGRGIAYSTREPAHVLNVFAEVMGAWPEDPEEFARLVEAEGGNARDFVERRRFGRYMDTILAEATRDGVVTPVEAMAVSATRDEAGWAIGLDDGSTLSARALVLAAGNQEPAPLVVAKGISPQRFINNPWGPEARAADERLAGSDRSVLLIGTGLTAVDHILSLDAGGHLGWERPLQRVPPGDADDGDRLDLGRALLRERDRGRDHLLADVAELDRHEDTPELGARGELLDRQHLLEQTVPLGTPHDDEDDEPDREPGRAGIAGAVVRREGEDPDRERERRPDECGQRERVAADADVRASVERPLEVGLRPGEKLYEELLIDAEAEETIHPRIRRAHEATLDGAKLDALLEALFAALAEGDRNAALALLPQLVPEYTPGADGQPVALPTQATR